MPSFIPGSDDARVGRLCELLAKAEAAIEAQPRETWLEGFDNNATFAACVRDARHRLAADRVSWLGRQKLKLAFTPTSDWDDCVGDVALGNEIYDLLLTLYGHFL